MIHSFTRMRVSEAKMRYNKAMLFLHANKCVSLFLCLSLSSMLLMYLISLILSNRSLKSKIYSNRVLIWKFHCQSFKCYTNLASQTLYNIKNCMPLDVLHSSSWMCCHVMLKPLKRIMQNTVKLMGLTASK